MYRRSSDRGVAMTQMKNAKMLHEKMKMKMSMILLPLVATGALAATKAPAAAAAVCAAPQQNLKIVSPAAPAAAAGARVYFRSASAKSEHYVEMKRGGKSYWATLPRPLTATTRFDYRISWLDAEMNETPLRPITVEVTPRCAVRPLGGEEQRFAANLVIGTPSGAPPVPEGFDCTGIIGEIGSDGKLKPHEGCRALQIAAAAQSDNEAKPATTNQAGASRVTSEDESDASELASTNVIGPTHHRRPRRAPQTPPPPTPRVSNPRPISPSNP